ADALEDAGAAGELLAFVEGHLSWLPLLISDLEGRPSAASTEVVRALLACMDESLGSLREAVRQSGV
ncbi:MAG: hypothetical protein HUK26_08175, partial [Duodenibacillus sp.]|nr:hypothetical protein [Duodenibacillus sp.]